MSKMTAKNIIGAIGRDKVAERLNVGRNAVSATQRSLCSMSDKASRWQIVGRDIIVQEFRHVRKN